MLGKPCPGSRRRQLSSPSQWVSAEPPRSLQGLVSRTEPPRSLQGLEYRMQATRGAGTGGHGQPRAGPSQEGLGLLPWEEVVG